MNKDRVVIEEGGMRYVFGLMDGTQCCDTCNAAFVCSSRLSSICGVIGEFIVCISATKIEPEPKMYFAWNREEARRLVGRNVEYFIDGDWHVDELKRIEGSKFENHPFYILRGNVFAIREIPTIEMTMAQLREKYNVPDNVVVVERD